MIVNDMFNGLIGNEAVKTQLTRLVSGRRVPNSLIFAGPDGIGKREFALRLARSFVCRDQACGTCSPCLRSGNFQLPRTDDKEAFKRIVFSEHADVGMILPYNRSILVDAIRELEREAYFRPYEAPSRVFLIDNADRMNDAAANALLKTLEEPAATAFISLVTSRPDSLLQTIRSRCQLIRFAPIATPEIAKFLRERGTEPADTLANCSNGSLGAAMSADAAAFTARRQEMFAVIKALLSQNSLAELMNRSEKLNEAKNKDLFEDNLQVLSELVRDVWLLSLGGQNLTNADMSGELKNCIGSARPATFARWLEAIEELRQSLAVNVNRKIATDALFLKMATAKQTV